MNKAGLSPNEYAYDIIIHIFVLVTIPILLDNPIPYRLHYLVFFENIYKIKSKKQEYTLFRQFRVFMMDDLPFFLFFTSQI